MAKAYKSMRVVGKHLHVIVRPKVAGAVYRAHDVGAPKHTKRLAMFLPRKKRWVTKSWHFPLEDIVNRRPTTMRILGNLGAIKAATKIAKKHMRR